MMTPQQTQHSQSNLNTTTIPRYMHSPSPNLVPFGYGTTLRGRRESEIYERVQGVDDLLHQIEFPQENHVSSDQFQIGRRTKSHNFIKITVNNSSFFFK